jgi:hypothetical protein
MNRSGLSHRSQRLAWLLPALLILSVAAHATQSGITRTDADLRAAPYNDANLVITLAKDTQLQILGRRGAWLQVNVEAYGAGYVRLHLVRIGDSADRERSSFSGIASLWRSLTGRSSSSGLVATTGIRGLEDQDLRNARPNPEAVGALEAYQATDDQARMHAEQAGLVTQQVAYEPKKYKKKKKSKRRKKRK